MPIDYSHYTADDLLEALELAGRIPDEDLLRAGLGRREEIVPGLLEMLRSGINPEWDENDPRLYRDIHAGNLLIEFREEAALPEFEAILRDENRYDALIEWFDGRLSLYGAAIVPVLERVALDGDAYIGGRLAATDLLSDIAVFHPQTRDRVVEVLHTLLPPVNAFGIPMLPVDPEELPDEAFELWAFAMASLLELRDAALRNKIAALYEYGLVDESIVGDLDGVLRDFDTPAPEKTAPPDIFTFYKELREQDSRSPQEHRKSMRQALLEGGISEEEVNQIIGSTPGDLDDEQFAAVMGVRLDQIRDELRAQGVPESKLDDAVEDVLANLMEKMEGLSAMGRDNGDPWVPSPPPLPAGSQQPVMRETPKVGRNDSCPCGSGRKYKHCCGKGVH